MMKRNSSVDLLRILSMSLVTLIHFFAYTGILEVSEMTVGTTIGLTVMYSLSRCAVNTFFLISGYFLIGKRFNKTRVLNVYFEAWFVSVFVLVISLVLSINTVTRLDYVKSVFPFLSAHYWYLFDYIVVVVLSPTLNCVVDHMPKKELCRLLVIIGAVISVVITLNPLIVTNSYIGGDHNILWAIYCYVLGAYLGKYQFKVRWSTPFLVFIFSWISLSVILLVLRSVRYFDGINLDFVSNCSVLPFIMSVSLFVLFLNLKVDKPFITNVIFFFAKCSFCVYLVQEHNVLRYWIWNHIDPIAVSTSYISCLLTFMKYLLLIWCAAVLLHVIYESVRKIGTIVQRRVINGKN